MTGTQIETFIAALAATSAPPRSYNPFTHPIKRDNLRLYLNEIATRQPPTLLVGEAPGYKGMRLTGVPFTSETILLDGVPAGLYGASKGYRKTDETERPTREQTATIIWNTLANVRRVPLMWNAFPFHPHKADNPTTSNRPPLVDELALGQRFLADLMSMYSIEQVIAIGNKAHDSLTRMGVDCVKVRHPAQGGKADFVAGMHAALGDDLR